VGCSELYLSGLPAVLGQCLVAPALMPLAADALIEVGKAALVRVKGKAGRRVSICERAALSDVPCRFALCSCVTRWTNAGKRELE